MRRLLLDQCIPRSTIQALRDGGLDVVHTAEIGMSTARDDEILERARQDNRAVVTLDADFHALMAVSGATDPSVVRIRQDRLKGTQIAALVLQVLDSVSGQWDRGVLVTVNERVIRVHRLPVVRNQ